MPRVELGSTRVDASFLFYKAQLEGLENKLDQSVLSMRELKSISEQLDILKDKALGPDSKDTYQSLCGRVDTLSINNFIDAIVEESFSLREGKYSSPEELSERIKILNKEIAKIWYNNGLSLENRRYIKIAKTNLNCLSPFSKTDDIIQPHRKLQSKLPPNENDAEIAFDLCEMAHLLYQNKFQEGLKKFNQLLPSFKARLEDHCLRVGAELITKNRSPLNCIRFIQASIGYANELAQGEDIDYYPSISEVRLMFEEVVSYS